MSSNALELLREHDPARALVALDDHARQAHRDAVLSNAVGRELVAPRRPLRRLAHGAVFVAAALVFGVGVAWASGVLSPLAVFENNAQKDGNPPGGIWDQSVVPGSIRQVSSVQ